MASVLLENGADMKLNHRHAMSYVESFEMQLLMEDYLIRQEVGSTTPYNLLTFMYIIYFQDQPSGEAGMGPYEVRVPPGADIGVSTTTENLAMDLEHSGKEM